MMSHTVDGQTTNYTWDAAAGLPVVLQDNTYTYVYGLDLISATDSGGNQNYYMYNGQGSVANIVDYSGAEKARYLYDAFGNTRYELELTPNVWKYTGEQQDDGTGFYYLRARYYDPFLGRFVSQDPLRAGNLYTYVGNSPVNYVDRSGLFAHGCVKDPVKCAKNNVVDPIADVAEEVPEYVSDKSRDIAHAVGNCTASALSCGNDLAAAAISLTCHGERRTGPYGWVYYENAVGGCVLINKFDSTTCNTPGFITFCEIEPGRNLKCHEFQHYVHNRLVPAPFYWLVDLTVGEATADRAQKNYETYFPYTGLSLGSCPVS